MASQTQQRRLDRSPQRRSTRNPPKENYKQGIHAHSTSSPLYQTFANCLHKSPTLRLIPGCPEQQISQQPSSSVLQ